MGSRECHSPFLHVVSFLGWPGWGGPLLLPLCMLRLHWVSCREHLHSPETAAAFWGRGTGCSLGEGARNHGASYGCIRAVLHQKVSKVLGRGIHKVTLHSLATDLSVRLKPYSESKGDAQSLIQIAFAPAQSSRSISCLPPVTKQERWPVLPSLCLLAIITVCSVWGACQGEYGVTCLGFGLRPLFSSHVVRIRFLDVLCSI